MVRARILAIVVVAASLVGGATLAIAADEASKSPKQIVSDAARALSQVRSMHMEGFVTDADGRTTLSGDITAAGDANLTMTLARQRVGIRAIDSKVYLRASRKYWRNSAQVSDAKARKLAGHWVHLTSMSAESFGISDLRPREMAYCLTRNFGTLSKSGIQSLGGRRVVVITDAGDKPGTAPGKLYVAATGLPLPLRIVQTGRIRPGGHVDKRCDDGEPNTSTAGDMRLSSFNAVERIVAPPHPLTLDLR